MEIALDHMQSLKNECVKIEFLCCLCTVCKKRDGILSKGNIKRVSLIDEEKKKTKRFMMKLEIIRLNCVCILKK